MLLIQPAMQLYAGRRPVGAGSSAAVRAFADPHPNIMRTMLLLLSGPLVLFHNFRVSGLIILYLCAVHPLENQVF